MWLWDKNAKNYKCYVLRKKLTQKEAGSSGAISCNCQEIASKSARLECKKLPAIHLIYEKRNHLRIWAKT